MLLLVVIVSFGPEFRVGLMTIPDWFGRFDFDGLGVWGIILVELPPFFDVIRLLSFPVPPWLLLFAVIGSGGIWGVSVKPQPLSPIGLQLHPLLRLQLSLPLIRLVDHSALP
jgi:hypothetical protein